MPIQFKGVIQEHKCVRDGVGIFDVSHMGEIEITGPDAKHLIQYLVTNDIETMQNNQVLYTLMCLETGGVFDDLLVETSEVKIKPHSLKRKTGKKSTKVEFMIITILFEYTSPHLWGFIIFLSNKIM